MRLAIFKFQNFHVGFFFFLSEKNFSCKHFLILFVFLKQKPLWRVYSFTGPFFITKSATTNYFLTLTAHNCHYQPISAQTHILTCHIHSHEMYKTRTSKVVNTFLATMTYIFYSLIQTIQYISAYTDTLFCSFIQTEKNCHF